MSAYDNLIANIDKTAYTSVWDMDKIIGTAEGTVSVGVPPVASSVTVVATHSTTFGDSYFFLGIYSTDGGATWNDFNAMVPDLTTPAMPVFQTLNVQGAVGSSGTMNVIVTNYYDSVHGTGTAKTVKWKVVFISKNDQGSITPSLIADPTMFTSVDRNYQKIAFKDSVPFNITSGSGKSVTISHDLGFVPQVRAYYFQATPSVRVDNLWAGYFIDTRVTETTLSFVLNSFHSIANYTGVIQFRLYYNT